MSEIKLCRICLQTEIKLYNVHQYQLKTYYDEVINNINSDMDDLPQYFCFECAYLLYKFHKFKEKCSIGYKILTEMLCRGPITNNTINDSYTFNSNMKPSLKIVNVFEINYTFKEEPKYEEIHTKVENVDTEIDNNVSTGEDNQDIDTNAKYIDSLNTEDELNIYGHKNPDESKSLHTYDNENDSKNGILRHKISLDEPFWKKHEMSEEEAVEQFKARAENDKYKSAPFKCTDCFKGFSKENILKRHKILRHNEIYKIECPFCHMRFKLNCFMQKHLRGHYTKYECRRCNVVYPLEGSALFHEEFHSGVIRTCRHCNEEFRHSSTYYSHLRTHKSEFVCCVCGSSFVSEAGLHQHKRIKHCDSVESPDDEEMNTFCTKCDISFESRPAYDEHLLHSIKHIEDIENDNEVVQDKRKKVLGKRMKEKITGQLSKKSRNMTKSERKSCKRRRQPRKPTTCHQCGKHFDTQAACMKHHVTEHPRTSFTAPHQRHICEICGASLAPGSVIAHQNMHSREKVHPCETCGKQFYTTISLKRHSVTHTGEKPFPCSLCDKRFTQSNSMKLHYRTFHLKQPYPKRNRRKKKMNDSMEESHSEDSSDVKTKKKTVHEQGVQASAITVQVISDTNSLFNFCG
ncbi:zinc finger protein 62-like [Danaus plexippus]|uniref:zinc finger protein 62-like n=1 Tax=Danaus plexippus TaxID=13037 RepID=UPI002AB226DB|nr:zinc finger protein 62-like [Danaus plexippus]